MADGGCASRFDSEVLFDTVVVGVVLGPSCSTGGASGGGVTKTVTSGWGSVLDAVIDVSVGFNGVIVELVMGENPAPLSPALTSVPFAFPVTKMGTFAELVELAVPTDTIGLCPPGVATTDTEPFGRPDEAELDIATGAEARANAVVGLASTLAPRLV